MVEVRSKCGRGIVQVELWCGLAPKPKLTHNFICVKGNIKVKRQCVQARSAEVLELRADP